MQVDIAVPLSYTSSITSDLLKRRAEIDNQTIRGESAVNEIFLFLSKYFMFIEMRIIRAEIFEMFDQFD